MVFNSAEEINGLYVVLNGTLESFFYENGNYYTNKILKQGAIVGTSRFLTGGRHTGLKCRTDAIVAYVSHDVLIRWDKQALLQLLSTQSRKNQHLINQITTLSLCSCTKRLLLFLYEMAKDNLTMGRMDIPVQISISNKDIASIINTSREIELLAVVDGEVVGTAGIDAVGTKYKVAHRAEFGISVLKEFWGLGIGRAMMDACIQCARDAGYVQLELSVVADNARAIAMYQRAGFVECGRNPRGFRSRAAGYQEVASMLLTL